MGNRGHARERQVRRLLEDEGYWVCRAAGSLGDADLVACRTAPALNGMPLAHVQLIEVKANVDGGPYMNFRPEDRIALKEAAAKAGAEAVLCYWPARKDPKWIPADQWP